MSLTSHKARTALAFAGVSAAAALGAASTAQAVTITQLYQCGYPLIGDQPTLVTADVGVPATALVGVATGRFPIAAKAVLYKETIEGLATVNVRSLGGSAEGYAVLVEPSGGVRNITATGINVPSTPIPRPNADPAQSVTLEGISGSTPSLVFTREGLVPVSLEKLTFNIAGKDLAGNPVPLDDQTPDTPDSDGDVNTFDVDCILEANQPTSLGSIRVGQPLEDTVAPTAPSALAVVGAPTYNTVSLKWNAATDNVAVAGYDILDGSDTVIGTSANTATTLSGLASSTTHTFKVRARDAAGNTGPVSNVVTATTPEAPTPGVVKFPLDLKGKSTLKTLVKGDLPLSGTIDAELTTATGEFNADLVLNKTRGRLTALGFLPLTADVAFVQSGKTTGSLKDGVLKTKSFMKIRLPQVYLFGSVPIGAAGCQTKRVSEVNLQSTEPQFTATVGGRIAGTYAISDLQGCGLLNGLISPLAAGGGNTINAALTPRK